MQKFYLIIPVVLILVIMSGCQQIGQYEGKTAEQWFKEYDLVEAKNHDLQNQISDLESERDDLQSQNDDLQSQYDDMESENGDLEDNLNKLKSCIEDYPHDAEDECL